MPSGMQWAVDGTTGSAAYPGPPCTRPLLCPTAAVIPACSDAACYSAPRMGAHMAVRHQLIAREPSVLWAVLEDESRYAD